MQSALPPGLACLRNYCLKPGSQHARLVNGVVQLLFQALNSRIIHRYPESLVCLANPRDNFKPDVGQPILAAPDLSRSGTSRLESRLQAGLPAPQFRSTAPLQSRLGKQLSPIAERAVFAIAGEMPTVVRIAFFE